MSRRQRMSFGGTGWEALEGRRLLSQGMGTGYLASLRHQAAVLARQAWRAQHPGPHALRAAQHAAGGQTIAAAGPVATAATVIPGGVPAVPGGGISALGNFAPVRRPSFPDLNAATVGAQPAPSYAFHPNFGPINLPAGIASKYGSLGSQTDGGGIVTQSYIPPAPTLAPTPAPAVVPQAPPGLALAASAVPPGLALAGSTVPTGQGTTGTAVPPGLGVVGSVGPGAPGITAPPTGTLTPSPAFGMPVGSAAPAGLLGDVTLSKTDVSALKTTVDAFATSYTAGKDTAADKAALDAFKTGLQDVALGVWSETHVAAPADVANLQKAVDGFAQTYTSGASLAQDKAAWKALHTALNAFHGSLTNPAATGTTTATTATNAVASPATSPANATGRLLAPGFRVKPMPMPGAGADPAGFAGPLLNGPALTADEVSGLRTAVDAFATSYTSGADAAKDKAAVQSLQTALVGLFAKHVPVAPLTNAPPTATTTPATPPRQMVPLGASRFTTALNGAPTSAVKVDGSPTGAG